MSSDFRSPRLPRRKLPPAGRGPRKDHSMKISTTDHNVANWIAHHVQRRFPQLAANPIDGVWFTGSNVWSLLYGVPSVSAEAGDWDIFTLTELAALQLVTCMGWNLLPSFPTRDKRSKERDLVVDADRIPKLSTKTDPGGIPYSGGYCYVTPQGEVDRRLANLDVTPEQAAAGVRAWDVKERSDG